MIFLPSRVVWKSFQLYAILLQWCASDCFISCKHWQLSFFPCLKMASFFNSLLLFILRIYIWYFLLLAYKVITFPFPCYCRVFFSRGPVEVLYPNVFWLSVVKLCLLTNWGGFLSRYSMRGESNTVHKCILTLFGYVLKKN